MKRIAVAGFMVFLTFLLFQPVLGAVSNYLTVTPSDGIVPKGGSIAFETNFPGIKHFRVQIYKVSNINYLLKDSGWVAETAYNFDLGDLNTGSYLYIAFARTSSSTQESITADDTPLGWEYFYVNGAPFQFEAGTLSVGSNWKTVSLTKTFTNPVVVIKSVEGCDNPSTAKDLCDYLTPRVRNVTSNSFEVMLQAVPKDTSLSGSKNVSYLVVEAGRYKIGGFDIEAGKLNTSNFALLQSNPITATKFYPKFEKEPVLITTITTFNGPEPATTRNKTHYFPVHMGPITVEVHISDFRDGFVSLIDEPGWDPFLEHKNEEISYLAITPGAGVIDGKKIYVGEENVSSTAKTISFNGMFSKNPHLIADMQRMYGSDWSIVRHASLTAESAKLLVAEVDGGDHRVEPVGYILIAAGSDTNPISLAANFTAAPMQGAPPLDVNFDASASANAVSYAWDFGDGSSGSGVRTSHRFDKNGTYTVTLTVTDASGNTATAQKDIVVEAEGCSSNADCPCGDGCYNKECLHPLISISRGQNQVVGFRGKPKDISTTWTLTNTGNKTAFVMGFWTPGCEGQSCEIKLLENGGKIVTPNAGAVPEKPATGGSSPTPTPSVSPSPSPSQGGAHKVTVKIEGTGHGYVGFQNSAASGSNCCCSPGWCDVGGCEDFKCSDNGYPQGLFMTFGASNAPDSVFAGWSGDCSGTSTSCNLVLDSDKTITATFNLKTSSTPTPAPSSSFSFTGVKVLPNPLTGGSATFEAVGDGIVEIDVKVFDLSGALVFDSGFVSGSSFAWDGRNSAGEQLANGSYLYKITAHGASGEEKTRGPETVVILFKPAGEQNGAIFFAGGVKADFTYTYPDPNEPGVRGCFVLDASSSIDPNNKIYEYDWNFSDPNCQVAVDMKSTQFNNPILKHCWCYNCPWESDVPIKLTVKDASGNVLDTITKTIHAVKECGSPSPSTSTPSPSYTVTPDSEPSNPGSTPGPVPSAPGSSPTPSPEPSVAGSPVDYNCSNYNFGSEISLSTPLFAIEPGGSVRVEEIVRGVSPPAEKRELSLGFAVHYTDAFGKSNKVAKAHAETNIVLANLSSEKFHVKLGLKEQSACVGWNDLYGATGEGVVPRVLFDWSFKSGDSEAVAINQCDKGNEDFTYCDATQFSIELLKKLHRIDELANSGEPGVSAFEEFRAYIIADNFSEDFRKDFNYYYQHGFFSAPSWFADPSTPWASYFTDFTRLKFEPAQVAESGLYNVRLEFSFDGAEYAFFHDGEPRASITVKFEKLHPAGVEVVDSPFYYLPFDGLVGTQRVDEDGKKERKDYGLGFVNENGELKLAYVNGNLVLTSPNGGKTVFRTRKESDFNTLNVWERGQVLSINLADETMDFSPSYAMPVIMGLQSSGGSAQAFYLPFKGESLVGLTAPVSYWTGVGSSPSLNCKDFVGNALPYRVGDKRADLVQGSCSVLEGSEHAFGLFWPSALNDGDRLFLKTVFYSAFDDAWKISAACDSVSGVREVFASPLGVSSSHNQYLVLQQPGSGIETFKDLVNRIGSSEVCMAFSDGKYVFFWNPEKIEEGIGTAGQRIGAEWSFNWENYKCGSGATGSLQPSDIAANGLKLAYNAPSSLIATESFSFTNGDVLTRNSILQTALTGLADEQVCMSLGEFRGNPGFSGGVSNGQEDRVFYGGAGSVSVRLSAICDEGSNLVDTISGHSSLDPAWAENCSCTNDPGLAHQLCCLMALRD